MKGSAASFSVLLTDSIIGSSAHIERACDRSLLWRLFDFRLLGRDGGAKPWVSDSAVLSELEGAVLFFTILASASGLLLEHRTGSLWVMDDHGGEASPTVAVPQVRGREDISRQSTSGLRGLSLLSELVVLADGLVQVSQPHELPLPLRGERKVCGELAAPLFWPGRSVVAGAVGHS